MIYMICMILFASPAEARLPQVQLRRKLRKFAHFRGFRFQTATFETGSDESDKKIQRRNIYHLETAVSPTSKFQLTVLGR